MPKTKKKLLPKDFDVLLKAGDIAALKAVFDTCDINARGGYGKHTALAFFDCPDDLARWLVENGADIQAQDTYSRTPLHNRAACLRGQIGVLLELGADIHAQDTYSDTPLHAAAKFGNVEAVRLLLERGARPDALNSSNLTPLAAALRDCSNAQIESKVAIAELLLQADASNIKPTGGLVKRLLLGKSNQQAHITPQIQALVRRIGEDFEFHRARFNPDLLEATSAALDRLYALFGVPPVPRRTMHDGRAPIVAKSACWQDQHRELWKLLVPSQGAASTVQGEVIRIAGRVADEIDGNGGTNWDSDYRKMVRAFLMHIGSGVPLPEAERDRAAQLAAGVKEREGAGSGLCELAVHWVRLNPTPMALASPDYAR